MVATRVELHCPNGHPKTLLVTLSHVRDEPDMLSSTRVRCGTCGADFGLPRETQEQLLATARHTHEPVVSATTV